MSHLRGKPGRLHQRGHACRPRQRPTHEQHLRGSGGGQGGNYRSSLDACEPQNPTKSEEYQRNLQGVLYSA
eukprot:9315688-Pyramimonas_sp.AAC.1